MCLTILYTVWVKKKPLRFSGVFPKLLGIIRPNFTRLLYVPIYARLQIFTQLPATLMKLCRMKRDHPVQIVRKMSTIGRNARWHFLTFFPNSWEFLIKILHAYYTFISTLECTFLFNCLQLWWSYPILRATTQRPNFTRLLYVPIYARLQIFTQLPATLMKLCRMKCDHPVQIMRNMSTIGRNARWHFLTFFPNSWEFLIKLYMPIIRSYLR